MEIDLHKALDQLDTNDLEKLSALLISACQANDMNGRERDELTKLCSKVFFLRVERGEAEDIEQPLPKKTIRPTKTKTTKQMSKTNGAIITMLLFALVLAFSA